MNWKNVLIGVILYILGNIVFAFGFFVGVQHSSPPTGAPTGFAYGFYGLLTLYTGGAIPGLAATAIYFASTWILRRRRLQYSALPAALISLALTFVLGIGIPLFVYPATRDNARAQLVHGTKWKAELVCSFCKDPATPVLMRDSNGEVIGRYPQGTEATVKGSANASGTTYLVVTVTEDTGRTRTGVVMKRYLRPMR